MPYEKTTRECEPTTTISYEFPKFFHFFRFMVDLLSRWNRKTVLSAFDFLFFEENVKVSHQISLSAQPFFESISKIED